MSAKPPKAPRLVRVGWLDARIQPGWTDGHYDNPPMYTVGYLTRRTKKNVFLAGTWDSDKGNYADVSCIPAGCVVTIVDLTPTAADPPKKEKPPCVEPPSLQS